MQSSRLARSLAAVIGLGLGCAGLGCGGSGADTPTTQVGERVETPDEAATRRPVRSSWGPAAPDVGAELIAAELGRDPRAPVIASKLASAGDERARALWSLARIGGDQARAQLSAELDRAQAQSLAAAALLEVPRSDPDQPPEPAVPGPWAALEDGLWTRYAVSDPAMIGGTRALLLAIARVGGSRSVARLAVDLAELPGPSHSPATIERWASAMEALGVLCARGHGLDAGTVSAVLAGIEPRPGVDPELARAALYALSRCTRSSSELLVESRELLIGRLGAHVHGSTGARAALAWRTFAELGELPETIPAAVLGPNPPAWTTEVEAVRALSGTPQGADVVRERLVGAALDGFEGPRQHVLIESLRAMRADIAAAPGLADAQLVTVAGWLTTGRRSEDPRRRKLAALALCELRLLQAIRSGDTSGLVGCEQLAGAPTVALPTSLLVNLEVEALLRATRPDAPANATLSVAEIDDEAAIPDAGEGGPVDPGRRVRIARLIELARDLDPARSGPALHALTEIDDPSVDPVLRGALVSADPGILAAAATAVAVRSIDAGKRDPGLVELLETVVRSRISAAEIEARLAAIEALGALGRTAVANIDPTRDAGAGPAPEGAGPSPWLARTLVPLAGDPHAAVRARAREALLGHDDLLAAFDKAAAVASAGARQRPFPPALDEALRAWGSAPAAGLRVRTSAGVFTIEFTGVPAPINQANLVALARRGYFDGLSFHRVVPGFVVQGGDPRGDGYGGPGYVVPCEWSNLSYARGTVGIALAGKDTGGSQFFVTQTPQPHLDARYTIVGQVGEGLEVVDSLLPGDSIEAIEILSFEDP